MKYNNNIKQLLSKIEPLSLIKGIFPLSTPSLAYPCTLPTVNAANLAQLKIEDEFGTLAQAK